jgi:hypothetical protein
MLDALMSVWLLLSGAFGEAQQEHRVGTQCARETALGVLSTGDTMTNRLRNGAR